METFFFFFQLTRWKPKTSWLHLSSFIRNMENGCCREKLDSVLNSSLSRKYITNKSIQRKTSDLLATKVDKPTRSVGVQIRCASTFEVEAENTSKMSQNKRITRDIEELLVLLWECHNIRVLLCLHINSSGQIVVGSAPLIIQWICGRQFGTGLFRTHFRLTYKNI